MKKFLLGAMVSGNKIPGLGLGFDFEFPPFAVLN